MIVISDTSPVNYLVLIGHADILSTLFGRVVIPNAVFIELQRPSTPTIVRNWFANPLRYIVALLRGLPAKDTGSV